MRDADEASATQLTESGCLGSASRRQRLRLTARLMTAFNLELTFCL